MILVVFLASVSLHDTLTYYQLQEYVQDAWASDSKLGKNAIGHIIHASGTSSAQGMLDCAPAFCTVMEAARFAYAIAASRSKSAPRDMDFQRATATV